MSRSASNAASSFSSASFTAGSIALTFSQAASSARAVLLSVVHAVSSFFATSALPDAFSFLKAR
jgi:hypothetical protein